MGYETIEITPMTPRIGAEVSGIDLTKSLGNQQFQELHDALMEHSVLFFLFLCVRNVKNKKFVQVSVRRA